MVSQQRLTSFDDIVHNSLEAERGFDKDVGTRVFHKSPIEARTSEALIIRSISHQKHISPELTKDSVRSVRPRTLQPPSLQCLSLQQDKDNSNILQKLFLLFWNGFELSSS